MDRRSFLFIFLITISFFLLNTFVFDRSGELQKNQDISRKELYEAKVAKMADIPLAPLFHDKNGENFATNALRFGDLYLTLQESETLPPMLYANGASLHLSLVNDLGIYSSSKDVKFPSIPSAKNMGDLQLVSNFQNLDKISTAIGEYANHRIHFPFAKLEGDAIALHPSTDGFIPVGVWSYEEKQFTLFEDTEGLKGWLPLERDSANLDSALRNERLYVLENDYQQVVFSTISGAVSELNLPFSSKTNTLSVVNPIAFDYELEKEHPENAMFPLSSYMGVDKSGITTKMEPKAGGYTPLLRRNIMGKSGVVSSQVSPSMYALGLREEGENFSPTTYKVGRFSANEIEFIGSEAHRKVTKTYKFVEGAPYTLELTIKVDGDVKGLWLTSGVPEAELVSGSYSPLLQWYNGKKGKMEKISLPKGEVDYPDVKPTWVSNSNGFFGIILDPVGATASGVQIEQYSGESIPTRISLIDPKYTPYPAKNYPGYVCSIPFEETANQGMATYIVYAGPYEDDILKMVDGALPGDGPNFISAITVQGFFSFISAPFAKFLYMVMQFFYFVTRSWGFSIILLTLLLRIILYPLNLWALKSTTKAQELAPEIERVKEKYKADPNRARMEQAMVYKNAGVNPFSAMLPMLIQLPFMIGLLELIKTTFELRGASFVPGWIDNLTAPDVLFSWNYPLFFFGTSFHLLPFILGGLMFAQNQMNRLQQEKKGPMTDQQKQMMSMGNIMMIGFTFIFYNMPSGLNIYWIFSTLFGMIQQWFMTKKIKKEQQVKILK
jgi:YidC/Oxa1 family membrane protein insertase